jgi:gas vesicle protein
MRKLTSWLIGFAVGAALGVTLVMLFSPMSGQELVGRLRQGWADTLEEARQANVARRAELETQLRQMQQRRPARR